MARILFFNKNIINLIVLLLVLSKFLYPAAKDQLISNVNLIPMDREQVIYNQDVLIKKGLISKIGKSGSLKVFSGVTIIKGKGMFLIPGLADMHIHLESAGILQIMSPEKKLTSSDINYSGLLFLYLANGITTVEIMSAVSDHIQLRGKISRGEILGPRLVLAPMIDKDPSAWPAPMVAGRVNNPEAARKAVLGFKKAGYDRIKVYSFLSKDVYKTILTTAREVNIKVDGHIPQSMSVEQVVAAGQNSIAHSEELMKFAKRDFSEKKAKYFAGLLSKAGTWITPTLITTRKIIANFDNLEQELKHPNMRYVHPLIYRWWSPKTNLYVPIPENIRNHIRKGFGFQKLLTKELFAARVNIMAGSDAMLPLLVAGFSLHDELQEFVELGVTPYQALRTSTTAPHSFLGESNLGGTITPGKRADLVLLKENPLKDIKNTRKIAGVMVRGLWLSESDIKNRLDKIAASRNK